MKEKEQPYIIDKPALLQKTRALYDLNEYELRALANAWNQKKAYIVPFEKIESMPSKYEINLK